MQLSGEVYTRQRNGSAKALRCKHFYVSGLLYLNGLLSSQVQPPGPPSPFNIVLLQLSLGLPRCPCPPGQSPFPSFFPSLPRRFECSGPPRQSLSSGN